ncbi:hypothetical protein BOTNAR_0019g00250 [Botryotinia narcissicola]|uniref:Uncharacterized protein n=1 Tax=Botryotinia narcissicola TaxID=278944 RepID=A0A4Z1J5I3_9HELO|nr:hypothetical protein BOTNAR_0019g00250 [Botryotinia narcissicola]
MNPQLSDMAHRDTDACPKHGYNLEWRTCLRCDTIKLYNQNSIASFVDLGGNPSREFNRQYLEAKVPAIENFPAENPYDSDSFDGPSNYSERRALNPSDDMGVSKEELSTPSKRRNRLHKTAKTKSGSAEGNLENGIEFLPLSDEMPQESRSGSFRNRGTNEKRRARDRHVSFAE